MKDKKTKVKKPSFKELLNNSIRVTNNKWEEANGLYIGTKEGQEALTAAATATEKITAAKRNVEEAKCNLARIGLAIAGMTLESTMLSETMNDCNYLRLATKGFLGAQEAEKAMKDFNLRKYYWSNK